MGRSSNSSALLALFRADPRCAWCRRETWLPEDGVTGPKKLEATRDHIRSRNHPKARGHRSNAVLACFGCNQQRCRDEMAMRAKKPLNKRGEIIRLIARGE